MSFFAFGVFSVSVYDPVLFVLSFKGRGIIFSLESDEDEEGMALVTVAVIVAGVPGCEDVDMNEKSPFVLIGVVPTSSQSPLTSLPCFLNKSDNEGFLLPFLFLSVLADSAPAFALPAPPEEFEDCALERDNDGGNNLLFLVSHCLTPDNVFGSGGLSAFPLCDDDCKDTTSTYSPCDVDGVIINEGLTGAPLLAPLNLGNSLESDA